ncbi:hypothetical protein [Streptomyces sp. CAU 1734]|uniref:hypothetical protein n=1 Tax=Streptomyces sp. CAU 1734 TaxID=3140360 RepID=UPI0032619451
MTRLSRADRPAKWITAPAWVAILSTMAFGCGKTEPEAERNYATPERICGTEIPARILEPALPPGEEIREKVKDLSGYKRCTLLVDGESEISLATDWNDQDFPMEGMASASFGPLYRGMKMIWKETHGFSATGAVGKVDCPSPRVAHRSEDMQLFVIVNTYERQVKEEDMEALVTGFARAVAVSDECTARRA